jgi:hypothetical protein
VATNATTADMKATAKSERLTSTTVDATPRGKVYRRAKARLMDAGTLLFGKLEGKSWVGGWLKLDIRVFLRDF